MFQAGTVSYVLVYKKHWFVPKANQVTDYFRNWSLICTLSNSICCGIWSYWAVGYQFLYRCNWLWNYCVLRMDRNIALIFIFWLWTVIRITLIVSVFRRCWLELSLFFIIAQQWAQLYYCCLPTQIYRNIWRIDIIVWAISDMYWNWQ